MVGAASVIVLCELHTKPVLDGAAVALDALLLLQHAAGDDT